MAQYLHKFLPQKGNYNFFPKSNLPFHILTRGSVSGPSPCHSLTHQNLSFLIGCLYSSIFILHILQFLQHSRSTTQCNSFNHKASQYCSMMVRLTGLFCRVSKPFGLICLTLDILLWRIIKLLNGVIFISDRTLSVTWKCINIYSNF